MSPSDIFFIGLSFVKSKVEEKKVKSDERMKWKKGAENRLNLFMCILCVMISKYVVMSWMNMP